MNTSNSLQYWSVWYPKAAATGLLIGRGMINPADTLLVHSPPPVLTAEVRNEAGDRLAYGQDLKQTQDSPICRLRRQDDHITREDIWPTSQDEGTLVLLPGGEVGTLLSWWNADDQKEWRWQVEFYNTLRD